MSRSEKLPAMPFYVGDWKKDPGVQSLDLFERGFWFELICLMWESSERGVLLLNGKPYPTKALANCLHLDESRLTPTLTHLVEMGIARVRESDGAIYSARMVRDEEKRAINKKNGGKGGNPHLKASGENPVNPNSTEKSKVGKPKLNRIIESESENENTNETENEDLNKKETVTVLIELPEALNSPTNRRLWNQWEARSASNGRPLDDIYRENTWCKYITRPGDLAIDLERTLSVTSAVNIIEESTRGPSPPGKSKFKTKTEQFSEDLQKIADY